MPLAEPWWAKVARALLVLVFLATGIGKLLDVPGFAAVLAEYRLLPSWLLLPAALGLGLFEIVVAAALVSQPIRRPAAIAALGLALLNAAVLSLTLARGIALANCGCFGVYWARPLRPWTPLEDLVLAALAAAILRGAAGPRRVAARA